MKKLILLISIILLLSEICFAGNYNRSVKAGNNLYHKGDFDQALKNYNEAAVDNPDSDIVNFNLASAFYQSTSSRRNQITALS